MAYARAKQLVGATALGLILAATPAWAGQAGQGTAPEAEPSSAEGGPSISDQGIKDIIVTAERRETTVQKTPIAITVLTPADLTRKAITSVDEALREVPGVVLQGNANGAYVYIRGVGSQQDTSIGGPAVNLNVDGIYQQQTEVPFAALYDIGRVEVLRGPQGTLYGRNANAGSINILTADPTTDAVHARMTVQGGNYDLVHIDGAVNVPVSETFAVRAAAVFNRHKGYIQPSGYDDDDTQGARVKALWRPSEAIRLLGAVEYLHIGGVGNGGVDALATHPAEPYFSTAPTGVTRLRFARYYGQLDADLGIGTLTILPALQVFRKFDNNVIINNPPAATSSAALVTENQKTIEARLASPASSPFTWLIGAYYLHADGGFPYVRAAIIPSNAPVSYPRQGGSQVESYAGFAQVTVPLTTAFRVTGGIRYTHDRRSLARETSATASTLFDTDFDSVTYKAGVEFDAGAQTLLYANVSTGFKAGGLDQGFNTYEPEKLRAIVAGAKNRFLDNRVQLNVEAFHYDYKNFQAQIGYRCQNAVACSTISTFANNIQNAGKAEVYGGEVELALQPWRNGRIGVNGAYNHSRFSELIVIPGTANNSPVGCAATLTCTVLPNQTLTSEALANAPKWTLQLNVQQDIPLGNGGRIAISADTRYSSGYWTLYRRPPQVPAESYQDTFWKHNASIGYVAPDDAWSIRAFGRNLSDKAVVTSAVGPALTLAPPRTYGVLLTAGF